MSQDMLFIIVWLLGCVVVALAMELVKLSGNKHKSIWWLYGALLTIVMTLSAWFGIDGHRGNMLLLPALFVAGYVLQLYIDQFGAKKVLLIIVNAFLKKRGYAQLKE